MHLAVLIAASQQASNSVHSILGNKSCACQDMDHLTKAKNSYFQGHWMLNRTHKQTIDLNCGVDFTLGQYISDGKDLKKTNVCSLKTWVGFEQTHWRWQVNYLASKQGFETANPSGKLPCSAPPYIILHLLGDNIEIKVKMITQMTVTFMSHHR